MQANKIAEQPVRQWMTKRVKTIQQNHTLIEAATLLLEHKINQLPVVDDEGRLVGYIGRSNIKQAIGDALSSTA
jgi:CBS domain-containing protein